MIRWQQVRLCNAIINVETKLASSFGYHSLMGIESIFNMQSKKCPIVAVTSFGKYKNSSSNCKCITDCYERNMTTLKTSRTDVKPFNTLVSRSEVFLSFFRFWRFTFVCHRHAIHVHSIQLSSPRSRKGWTKEEIGLSKRHLVTAKPTKMWKFALVNLREYPLEAHAMFHTRYVRYIVCRFSSTRMVYVFIFVF